MGGRTVGGRYGSSQAFRPGPRLGATPGQLTASSPPPTPAPSRGNSLQLPAVMHFFMLPYFTDLAPMLETLSELRLFERERGVEEILSFWIAGGKAW